MTSTWVVGDIHGCADELAQLVDQVQLAPGDRFISVGDLYHRGPNPLGVADLLAELSGFELVLGNHERAMLRRAGLVGERPDGADGLPLEQIGGEIPADALLGDGRTALLNVEADQAHRLLQILVQRPYYLRGGAAGEQSWVVVHAGVLPGVQPEQTPPTALSSLRRLEQVRGAPYWYEAYAGPDLVLFGHTPSRFPRACHARGELVALGLDTGCVYGGSLTAYRIEDGELAVIDAQRAYARG